MTLAELLRKAKAINDQFNSAEIPIMHGDQECRFDLIVEPPRGITEPWKIKIVNYREGEQ